MSCRAIAKVGDQILYLGSIEWIICEKEKATEFKANSVNTISEVNITVEDVKDNEYIRALFENAEHGNNIIMREKNGKYSRAKIIKKGDTKSVQRINGEIKNSERIGEAFNEKYGEQSIGKAGVIDK